MSDGSGELKDYKFYCFNGEPKSVLIVNGRTSSEGMTYDYFDMDFIRFPYRTKGAKSSSKQISKPNSFEQMLQFARLLSNNTIHVRVDLYNVDGIVYFGEWTFYDSSGYDKFIPDKWDGIVGSWMKLPKYKKEI